jgi:hypothetical protein
LGIHEHGLRFLETQERVRRIGKCRVQHIKKTLWLSDLGSGCSMTSETKAKINQGLLWNE